MAAPKLIDIARRAGVSVAAVSIALNDRQTNRVSAQTRELILQISAELGYTPNEIAKALAERRTRLIGLAVPLRDPIFFNQFIAQALSGIQSTLMTRGYNLLVYSPSGVKGRPTRAQFLDSKLTDGLIFINTRSCTARDVDQTIQDLDAAHVRYTMINSYYGQAAINYVGVDDTLIGLEAIERLVGLGHRRIAFLSGSKTLPVHIHLLRGLKKAARSAGIPWHADQVACTNYQPAAAIEALDRWFANEKVRPTAIFVADDTLLEHLYDYMDARGLVIPSDISVLARINTTGFSTHRPKPTSLQIPTFEMGRLAAEILIDSIERASDARSRVLLPFTFVEGRTVAAAKKTRSR